MSDDALIIPIKNSKEVVEVPLAELPTDPSDVVDILKAEIAPLDLWLNFAVNKIIFLTLRSPISKETTWMRSNKFCRKVLIQVRLNE